MTDFAGLMENFGKNAEKIVVPSLEKRKAMTKAGGEVLKENLYNETKVRHYQATRKIGKMKHLADSVAIDDKDVDGIDNGNSVVGFTGKDESGINHARIARFLNDGTKYITGDGFVDRTRRVSVAAVFEAERKVYEGGGGNGTTNNNG